MFNFIGLGKEDYELHLGAVVVYVGKLILVSGKTKWKTQEQVVTRGEVERGEPPLRVNR